MLYGGVRQICLVLFDAFDASAVYQVHRLRLLISLLPNVVVNLFWFLLLQRVFHVLGTILDKIRRLIHTRPLRQTIQDVNRSIRVEDMAPTRTTVRLSHSQFTEPEPSVEAVSTHKPQGQGQPHQSLTSS